MVAFLDAGHTRPNIDDNACALVAEDRWEPSGSAPESVNSSVWQMPVALISTRTSPAFGPSRSTVSIASGAPALCATAALTFMEGPFLTSASDGWYIRRMTQSRYRGRFAPSPTG